MHYLYFFTNADNAVIYVGKTGDIIKRMRQHFTCGHLPGECYQSVNRIFYAETGQGRYNNEILETMLIDKYKPQYNTDKFYNERYERLMFQEPELNWKELFVRYEMGTAKIYLTDPGFPCFDLKLCAGERAEKLLQYDIQLILHRRLFVQRKIENIIDMYGPAVLDELVDLCKSPVICASESSVDIVLDPYSENAAFAAVRTEKVPDALAASGMISYVSPGIVQIPLLNTKTMEWFNSAVRWRTDANVLPV